MESASSSSSSSSSRVSYSDETTVASSQGPLTAKGPPSVSPASLTWRNLTVSAGSKDILKGLSASVTSGFWAVMGPSGSGKTTLLNVLACRQLRGITVTGEKRLNGREYTKAEVKAVSGYVVETDVLNGMFTCGETLKFTAKLRRNADMKKEDDEKRINEVLDMMGLTHARDTLVGTPLIKGISGGERKRLCIAIELLTQPKLLFLDSPTSGLDSVAALSVCNRLKYLSSSGMCTVISTIMQPQMKIFNVFDNLLLLGSFGQTMYLGPAAAAPGYFGKLGFPTPKHQNPADHMLDVISANISMETESMCKTEWPVHQLTDDELSFGIEKPPIKTKNPVPWVVQWWTLCMRNILNLQRNWITVVVQMVQALIMGVLLGTIFLHIGNDQSYINIRQSVIFCCIINQSIFASLVAINVFPSERTLSLRERAAGTYNVSAYFFALSFVEFLLAVPSTFIFTVTAYFLIGFQSRPGNFFICYIFILLCSTAATSVAILITAFARTTDLAITVLPFVLEVFRLFGGFFKPPNIIADGHRWLDAISFVKYGYLGFSLVELQDLVYNCTPAQLVNTTNGTGVCPITSGEQVIALYGLDELNIGGNIGVLIGYIIGVRIIAWQAVRWINW